MYLENKKLDQLAYSIALKKMKHVNDLNEMYMKNVEYEKKLRKIHIKNALKTCLLSLFKRNININEVFFTEF